MERRALLEYVNSGKSHHGPGRVGQPRPVTPRRARGWLLLTGLLRSFLRPYTKQVGIVLVTLMIQAAGTLYLPDLSANIIDDGVVKGDVDYIWGTGGIMLGIVFAQGVVAVMTAYWGSRISMGVGASMRAAIYRQVQNFSIRDMSRFGIPSLITRNINDVQQVQLFLQMALTQLIIAVITSVGAVILAVREGPTLSLLIVATVPVMIMLIVALVVLLVPLSRSLQGRIDRLNQILREQIAGVRVVRAFRRTSWEQDRFQDANADITRIALRVGRIFAVAAPAVLGIANLSSVGVIWFGGRLVSEGSMPIGNMIAFLIYILQILVYLLVAITVIVLIPRAVASAERITQVIDAIPDIIDPSGPVIPARTTGTVEFRDMTFGYPGSERPVLTDLSFIFAPRQTSAIIGGTGSGKTTLLNLIPRFIDATSGAVLVNGTDVRLQSAEQLRSGIGLVPQAAFLFAGTVASNLRFGMPEATDEELWRALDIAQALDFVSSMPGQLNAPIHQRGTNVSGGQRQRLAIARALVRRPSLYLFDDCFSALDAATDARVRSALSAEVGGAAVVIVAQRVSTIMHADQIIVLDAGAVAGIGTHQQLLADCGHYREIVASQLGAGAAI
jgi:ABC-type multidrug transport system fused ATPase/permease subunit